MLAVAPLAGAADRGAKAAPDVKHGVAMTARRMPVLTDLDGVRHRLAEWRGRVVMLNFWASWCGPCLKEIPDLVAAQDDYRDRGLAIVGIGVDEAHKLRNVARTLAINYPVFAAGEDRGSGLLKAWGDEVGIVPYVVIIDRQGRVAETHRGPISRSELDEIVQPLLASPQEARVPDDAGPAGT